MKVKNYLLLCLVVMLAVTACKKHGTPKPGNTKMDTDVYVVGTIAMLDNGSGTLHRVAVYWKNGTLDTLSDPTQNWYATGVTSYNGKVYISGDQSTSATTETAAYWEIGASGVTRHDLPSSAAITFTYGVAANKDGVYVVGRTRDGTVASNRAVYWKDGGDIQPLPIPTTPGTYSYASGIYANEHDFYIAGGIGSTVVSAAYWKNGQLVKSGDGSNSYAYAITFDGTHVYTGGVENNQATFWEDTGNPIYPPVNSSVSSGIYALTVNSSKVLYASGFIKDASNNRMGAYWTNGTPITITPITDSDGLNGIATIGNDLYVTGTLKSDGSAAYWRNGVIKPLTMPANFGTTEVEGIAVAVHPH